MSELSIQKCLFQSCATGTSGGGCYIAISSSSVNAVMSECYLSSCIANRTYNSSNYGSGAGLYLSGTYCMYVSETSFSSCTARTNGGGIYLNEQTASFGYPLFTYLLFKSNSASSGIDIYLGYNHTTQITNECYTTTSSTSRIYPTKNSSWLNYTSSPTLYVTNLNAGIDKLCAHRTTTACTTIASTFSLFSSSIIYVTLLAGTHLPSSTVSVGSRTVTLQSDTNSTAVLLTSRLSSSLFTISTGDLSINNVDIAVNTTLSRELITISSTGYLSLQSLLLRLPGIRISKRVSNHLFLFRIL